MCEWKEASKKILNESDINKFSKSIAYQRLHRTLSFVVEKVKNNEVPTGILNIELVTKLNKNEASSKVKGPPLDGFHSNQMNNSGNSEINAMSDNAKGIVNILEHLNRLINETKPFEGPRRFGNLACRDWHDKVDKIMEALLKENLKSPPGLDFDGFIVELKHYILNSFGSKLRLDYGTGHELSFLAYLGSLIDFGILQKDEANGKTLLIIFAKYYDLCRRLILDYNLEPAGSHGVWGLDDHFHLIYIIGAAEYNSSSSYPPVRQVLTSQTINDFKSSNLYVNAISFIHRIKNGPFNEHSPIIYDIHSSVSLWSKVLSGLLKMYEVEVLSKFPVVQHFWFSSNLYPWRDFETNKLLPTSESVDEERPNAKDGFLNGASGIKTTAKNTSMTGAPWAIKSLTTNSRLPSRPIDRLHNNMTTNARK